MFSCQHIERHTEIRNIGYNNNEDSYAFSQKPSIFRGVIGSYCLYWRHAKQMEYSQGDLTGQY
jgi:hypothetical protein